MPLVSYDGPEAVDLCLPEGVVRVAPGGSPVDVPVDVAAELTARKSGEWTAAKPPAPPASKSGDKPKEG